MFELVEIMGMRTVRIGLASETESEAITEAKAAVVQRDSTRQRREGFKAAIVRKSKLYYPRGVYSDNILQSYTHRSTVCWIA